MQVRLRVEGDAPGEVESLHGWLREERLVRTHGDLAWGKSDKTGEMGVLIDVLTLVVGAGLSALQLAIAIASWRTSRPAAPVVTITRVGSDGTVTRIDTTDPQALAAAVRDLDET